MTFGEKPVADITTGDIEVYRHYRRAQRRSAVTINHDIKLLRKMHAWGIRERLLTATPFKVAGEDVIRLDPESPREERLTSGSACNGNSGTTERETVIKTSVVDSTGRSRPRPLSRSRLAATRGQGHAGD